MKHEKPTKKKRSPFTASGGSANVVARDRYPTCFHQIKSALIREIRDAQTWHDRVEAWEALLRTRHDAESMAEESRHLKGDIGKGDSANAP